MKRLILLVALVVLVTILVGSSASAVPDTTHIDSDMPDNEIATNQTEVSNSLIGATITIKMTGLLNE